MLKDAFINFFLALLASHFHDQAPRKNSQSISDSYDFCIAGGGDAGMVLAHRLSVKTKVIFLNYIINKYIIIDIFLSLVKSHLIGRRRFGVISGSSSIF